ncbi:uncharacterized protein G2W53_033322 [Senna tora]|uniref:Uncharacterized protein n=1 Tax=Senna tora TaxID=362788 RepID=A0A834WAW4_9FABA|nr:uncharacterized protein G2W53_033322 [Senna tora]
MQQWRSRSNHDTKSKSTLILELV